jgi:hypothetical protein
VSGIVWLEGLLEVSWSSSVNGIALHTPANVDWGMPIHVNLDAAPVLTLSV